MSEDLNTQIAQRLFGWVHIENNLWRDAAGATHYGVPVYATEGTYTEPAATALGGAASPVRTYRLYLFWRGSWLLFVQGRWDAAHPHCERRHLARGAVPGGVDAGRGAGETV